MSATEAKDRTAPGGTPSKTPSNDIGPSYTVRIVCCVLFVFLTEILLAHYLYRLIVSEMRSDYVAKPDFRHFFLNEIRADAFRGEVVHVIKDFEEARGPEKRERRSVQYHNYLGAQNEEAFLDEVMEENEEGAVRRQRGNKGGEGDDLYIWVTGSSKILAKDLQSYCKKVNELCPMKAGPKGPPGQKGDPGTPGLRGFPGVPGDSGTRGMPGLPGKKGEQGRPGLDGRDGIPGEPGLYGMPGRNGHDGVPGKDGIPGRDGKDGVDGQKGERGPPGPPGPTGPKGLTGPRGRAGKSGIDGKPGIPGVTAYHLVDKDDPSRYLIPPSIAGAQSGTMTVAVREGENVRLHCSATGTPTPRVTWQRTDGRSINRGAWQDGQVSAATLNLTRVNRDHMATYMCIADNGVPPQANHTFNLEVYFPPLIRISNQMVAVSNGSTAVLECETEAFPEPVRYWERSDGGLLENGDKYRIDNSLERNGYKSKMQLNITRVNAMDFSYLYHCLSKNELQTTRGELTLYEIDPRLPTLRPGPGKETVVGNSRPDPVAYDDLCPPIQCPDCEAAPKCIPGGVSLIDLVSRWEVRPYGDSRYGGYLNRSTDCVLYAVGKPVYHRYTDQTYGCWMKDPNPPNTELDGEKFWVTYEDHNAVLYEYNNKTMFRGNTSSKRYALDHPFGGNTHVILNGFFFYNVKGTSRIIKLHLQNQSQVPLDLPVPTNHTTKLYTGQYNHVDFSVDDNGLWVIFPVPDSNNTAVMKVDVDMMKPQYIWNISVDHRKVGEMFVVCGVLYAVDSVADRNTKIRFAFDLYRNVLLDINLAFSNPFRKTTMLGYNNRTKELYSWDRGNQLTYPVRYHEIGYNYTGKEEKLETQDNPTALMQTGYTIYN